MKARQFLAIASSAVGVVGSLAMQSAKAQATVPKAVYSSVAGPAINPHFTNLPNVPVSYSGSVPYDPKTFIEASARGNSTGPQMRAELSWTSSAGGMATASAGAGVTYYLDVRGPTSQTPRSVHLTAFGSYTFESSSNVSEAGALASIYVALPPYKPFCAGSAAVPVIGCSHSPTLVVDQDLQISPNTIVPVALSVRVYVDSWYTNSSTSYAIGSAFLDPVFSLSPEDVAAGYKLELSPGIIQSAVPEPATYPMMLSGALLLLVRRRARSSSQDFAAWIQALAPLHSC